MKQQKAKSVNSNDNTKSETKKITYLDSLMENSRFPEFKYRREFTELMYADFVAPAAAKCLEIKKKYNLLGRSMVMEEVLDVAFGENIYVDATPENQRAEGEEAWFGKDEESGTLFIWINPHLSVEDGQDFMLSGVAACLLYSDVYKNQPTHKNLDELTQYPELLKAILLADCLRCMFLSNETEAELINLQSIKKQGQVKKEVTKATEEDEIKAIANLLSTLLKSSVLPRQLYRAIIDEINTVYYDRLTILSKKNIELNLREMLKTEISEVKPNSTQPKSRRSKSTQTPLKAVA